MHTDVPKKMIRHPALCAEHPKRQTVEPLLLQHLCKERGHAAYEKAIPSHPAMFQERIDWLQGKQGKSYLLLKELNPKLFADEFHDIQLLHQAWTIPCASLC